MQIKENRPGYVQLVVNRYSTEKKRSVTEVLPGGSFSILKGAVPPDIWGQLSSDDQAKLMSYIGRRLAELNTGRLVEHAQAVPGTLAELGENWPTVISAVGVEEAEGLAAGIEAAAKAFKRAAAKAGKKAEKAASDRKK